MVGGAGQVGRGGRPLEQGGLRCVSHRGYCGIALRVAASVALVAGLCGLAPVGRAQASNESGGDDSLPPAFSGSAAAGGLRVTVKVADAPATDAPIDGGGPTAQVSVDSIGTSTGYAAFPDPGQFAVSLPGLVVGVLAGGAGGLPPIGLPSPPRYPFYVASDASNAPEQSAGAGPWALSASSETGSSRAQATAGFQTGLAGNAALATSTASLSPTDLGEVVAKATSDLQGLTVGPLTIGQVKSTATVTLNSSGAVTPSTQLEIVGLRVGGVPLELTPQGLVAGEATHPLPINPTLSSVLKGSGITVQVVSGRQFPDRVVAPALEITMPFTMPFGVPNVGQFSGTATVVVGLATAQMSRASADTGVGGIDSGSTPIDGPTNPEVAASGAVTPPSLVGGTGPGTFPSLTTEGSSALEGSSLVGGSSDATPPPTASATAPSELSIAAGAKATGRAGRPAALVGASRLDVRSSYLVVIAGAILVVATGQLIRRFGGGT